MAKLQKSDVPGKKAGPNGSFPIGDKKHARLAIGGATHSYNAGNISKNTEDSIKAQARAKLGHGGDRKSVEHHMTQAVNHLTGAAGNIQKALEKRLSQRDK